VYTRVSSDPAHNFKATQRQLKDSQGRIAQHSEWKLITVFNDDDTSTFKKVRRPQCELLLNAIEARDVDALIVYHADHQYWRLKDLEHQTAMVEKR